MDIDKILRPMSSIAMLMADAPHVVMSGQGCYVKDSDGKSYFSGDAGLGTTTLGFGQYVLAKVMYTVLGLYQTTINSSSQLQILLAEKLLSYVPSYFSKIFFANSGSEANESAIKIVGFYNNVQCKPEKRKIITRRLAHHGSTLSTVGISGMEEFHRDYGVNTDDSIYLSCPHYYNFALHEKSDTEYTTRLINELPDAIEKEEADNIATYIAEPIMGGGGVLEPSTDYFTQVQAVLRGYNILLICDEVLSGYGLTGTLSGYAHYSKQGLFVHGFTSCGHRVGASIALAMLSQLKELIILENVTKRGQHLLQGLNEALGNH
jgi:adenosylmethionine-8-amino-7-oxononanoate aminotransferase